MLVPVRRNDRGRNEGGGRPAHEIGAADIGDDARQQSGGDQHIHRVQKHPAQQHAQRHGEARRKKCQPVRLRQLLAHGDPPFEKRLVVL